MRNFREMVLTGILTGLMFTALVFQSLFAQTQILNEPAAAGEISVNPTQFDFFVPLNGTDSDQLTISNNGLESLFWNSYEVEIVSSVLFEITSDIRPQPNRRQHELQYADVRIAKGSADWRRGAPKPLDVGGPDLFGHQYIDSNEPGGPTFDWLDITTSGTQLVLGDDASAVVPLPFTFNFYGAPQTQVIVSSNGFLNFDGLGATEFQNTEIPNNSIPNNLIAGFWRDLNPGAGAGQVHHYFDSANGRFIVQFTNVRPFGGVSPFTFQMILNDDDTIVLQYLEMLGNRELATVGIENAAGDDGLEIVFNAPYIEDSLAVLINTGCPWLSNTPPGGTIVPGSSQNTTVAVDAAGLPAGIYECNLLLYSNDSTANPLTIPVTMTVGAPNISSDPDNLNFGDVLIGQTDQLPLNILNTGDGDLQVNATTVEGAAAGDYAVINGAPFIVPAGSSHLMMVTFSPSQAGLRQADIRIESNDPDEPVLLVGANGNGLMPANMPPVIDPVADQVMDEGGDLLVNITGSDPDGNAVTISTGALPAFATFQTSGNNASIRFQPGFDDANVFSDILLVASDDGQPSLSDSTTFTLTVNNVNRAPALDPVANQSVAEGDVLEIAVNAVDPDGDAIVLGVGNLPAFGTLIDNGDGSGMLRLEPQMGDADNYANIFLSATDDGSPSLSDTVSFDVLVTSGVDTIAPGCELLGVDRNEPFRVFAAVVDTESGIDHINILRDFNLNVTFSNFTPGTRDTVFITGTRIDPNESSWLLSVEAFDVAGNSTICDPVYDVLTSTAPNNFQLMQNYPNPFNPSTTIEFGVAGDGGEVRISIFDANGQQVRVLVNERMGAGTYRMKWDGRNDRGESVASGVYFLRMNAGSGGKMNFNSTRRMLLMK